MPPSTDDGRRVWLVTGASRGFGRAISEALPTRGERLVATARGADFVDSFGQDHPEALAVQLDVTEPGAATAAVMRPWTDSGASTCW